MRRDKKLFLLISDTGFHLVEPIFEEFPERTLNVGIAEQNLIGIAAGLCNVGFHPVCYAISNFLVLRCLEQIRNDICLHQYPIVLAGTSAGYDNGALWATHYVIDDIGCLKALPHMNIYSPSSSESMEKIIEEVMKFDRIAYVRITKTEYSDQNTPAINRFIVRQPDSAVLLITHGKIVKNGVEAAKMLPTFSVFAMDKIKPIDEQVTENLCNQYKKIVIAEDNFKSGLYNSVSQFIADKKMKNCELYFIGPEEDYGTRTGDVNYLLQQHGLTSSKISEFIQKLT